MLRAKAHTVGVALERSLYLKDPMHIELRLASLRLDPAGHPYREDHRLGLALRGLVASRRYRLSRSRRLLAAVWFLLAGILPTGPASRAICWKVMPASRPAAVNRSLRWLRRVLR